MRFIMDEFQSKKDQKTWKLVKIQNGDFRIYSNGKLQSSHSIKYVAMDVFEGIRIREVML